MAGQSTTLEGVRTPGRYLFLKAALPLGFAAGVVRVASAGTPQPFTGAVVSAAAFDVVSISGPGGGYFAAAPAGAATLTAVDAAKGDTGSATTFLTADAVLAVPLLIEPQAPRVVSIAPADGAANVALSDPIVVTFSKAIDASTVSGANAANVLLAGPGGSPVDAASALSNGNTVLTLRPASALAANTAYTITVSAAITDLAGRTLAAAVTSSFGSLDTAPPPPPPAGAITASVPGADGQTMISATQGTVARADTVHVVNLTDRTTRLLPQALYQANGSFQFQVPAKITDALRLRIVDPAGNETLVDLDRFQQTNADGSVSAVVGSTGGIVEGPGGVQVDVPDDTFAAGAVVTVASVPVESLAALLSAEDRQRFELQAALKVDFGGAEPSRYVNLSIPVRGDEPADSSWVVAQVLTIDGVQVLSAIDTAKIRDGRVMTSSPPFPGVWQGGTYTFVRSSGPLGVTHGRVLVMPGNEEIIKISTMTLSPTFMGVLSALPWLAGGPNAASWGFPLPAGRVTLSENLARLTVSSSVITPAHRMLRVLNAETNVARSFPIAPIDYRVQAAGKLTDGFEIVVVSGAGDRQAVTAASFTSAQPGTVTIRLNPDKITVPVARIEVKNRVSKQVTTFDFPPASLTVGVPGAIATPRLVELLDLAEKGTVVHPGQFDVVASPDGPGNLLLRIQAGTFQAGEAINARLVDQDTVQTPVPFGPGQVDSEFRFSFDGNANALYMFTVEREGHTYQYPIPRFVVELTDTATKKVLRTVSGFVPPPDSPLDLGTITDDVSRPYVVSGPNRVGSFDPGGTLVFTFSEAMDAASVKAFIRVTDVNGQAVAGEVRVTGKNTVATFVPARPLRMGETYTVTIAGSDPLTPEEIADGKKASAARDAAGNPIQTIVLKVTTFTPSRVGSLAGDAPFKDVAWRRRTDGDIKRTYLFVTTGGQSNNLVAVDATNPKAPGVVGYGSAAMSQQRIALLSDVSFTDRGGRPFQGDVAVTTQFNVNFSSMTFYDVTTPGAPAILGGKLLTLNPDFLEGSSPTTGAVMANGLARAVAAFKTATGVAAYAGVDHVGVMATDVAWNIPQRAAGDRVSEAVYSGQFSDLVAGRANLFATLPTAGQNFLVFDPGLGLVAGAGLSVHTEAVEDCRRPPGGRQRRRTHRRRRGLHVRRGGGRSRHFHRGRAQHGRAHGDRPDPNSRLRQGHRGRRGDAADRRGGGPRVGRSLTRRDRSLEARPGPG